MKNSVDMLGLLRDSGLFNREELTRITIVNRSFIQIRNGDPVAVNDLATKVKQVLGPNLGYAFDFVRTLSVTVDGSNAEDPREPTRAKSIIGARPRWSCYVREREDDSAEFFVVQSPSVEARSAFAKLGFTEVWADALQADWAREFAREEWQALEVDPPISGDLRGSTVA